MDTQTCNSVNWFRGSACQGSDRKWVYVYIYMYMHAVGSITWPHFGQSRVSNLATVGSITWPPFFKPIKIGVLGDFLCTVFRGWCKNSVFEKKLVKKGVSEKKNCAPFFGQFRFSWLLLHDVTRCFRRVCKKTYKIGFFWHTLLLDAEETEK